MDLFLVGGGWDDARARDLYGGFVDAATRRAGRPPRILLVVLGTDPESLEYHERYRRTLGLVGGHELVIHRVPEGSTFDPSALDGVDGLFVGGGPTPGYHASLSPAYAEIRTRVHAGMPYAGFSAGAAIAGTHAVIGGWRVDGRAVCPEESNEDLDPLTVVEGVGLVEGAVDVHASQWGNLSRLVAVVQEGLAPHGVAVDEDTVLGPGGVVRGAGHVWEVRRGPEEDGVTVRRRPAGQ